MNILWESHRLLWVTIMCYCLYQLNLSSSTSGMFQIFGYLFFPNVQYVLRKTDFSVFIVHFQSNFFSAHSENDKCFYSHTVVRPISLVANKNIFTATWNSSTSLSTTMKMPNGSRTFICFLHEGNFNRESFKITRSNSRECEGYNIRNSCDSFQDRYKRLHTFLFCNISPKAFVIEVIKYIYLWSIEFEVTYTSGEYLKFYKHPK